MMPPQGFGSVRQSPFEGQRLRPAGLGGLMQSPSLHQHMPSSPLTSSRGGSYGGLSGSSSRLGGLSGLGRTR